LNAAYLICQKKRRVTISEGKILVEGEEVSAQYVHDRLALVAPEHLRILGFEWDDPLAAFTPYHPKKMVAGGVFNPAFVETIKRVVTCVDLADGKLVLREVRCCPVGWVGFLFRNLF
jgi:hypothetical protein